MKGRDAQALPVTKNQPGSFNHRTSGNFVAEPVQNTDPISPDNQEKSKIWQDFVSSISDEIDKSLFSLLKNSVVLQLSSNHLVIGYKNIQLFTPEKKQAIDSFAKRFFGHHIDIDYKESGKGIDSSIQVKQNVKRKKDISQTKEAAKTDVRVLEVMKFFPGSTIKDIKIIQQEDSNGRHRHEGVARESQGNAEKP